MQVTTIDTLYVGQPRVAAAYLLVDRGRVAFVENNTAHAVPRLLEALEAAGRAPEDVDYVIITHAHLDHAGGTGPLMRACPNATLLAHPRAAPHMIDPTKLEKSARGVYGDAFFDEVYGVLESVDASRVRTVEDGETVTLGARPLHFLHTRGHANHHFCVHDPVSQVVFTGDSFGLVYPDLENEEGRALALASTTPTDFDAPAAKETLDRLVATGAQTAYLTHFGGVGDLAALAEQLHRQLDVYGRMVDEGDASEMLDDDLDAWAKERVSALFDELLVAHRRADEAARALVANDLDINAQGIAFAVKKRRFKAAAR